VTAAQKAARSRGPGRRLLVPPDVRPTTELARKAVFDILGGRVAGARVLDAAAGSGAYGIEAFSRGAREAVFVESEPKVRRVLEENLRGLALSGRSTVVGATLERFLSGSLLDEHPFDLIFHDPPYGTEAGEDLRRLRARLAPEGVLVHERGDDDDPLPDAVPPGERRRYGSTRLLLYRR
jgi:16S rRNA (guanine966-N2)-methyltransferase